LRDFQSVSVILYRTRGRVCAWSSV